MLKRAIFLDRDGVINRVIMKEGKPYSPRKLSDFRLTDGIRDVLIRLKEDGFLLLVVTNQPDISRGLIRWDELNVIHDLIRSELPVDDIIVCPHDNDDGCDCRKPKPGMIVDSARKWGIDIGGSFLIGDTWKDMGAGEKAGCTTILLDAPYNQDVNSNHRIKNISEALKIILPEHPR
jgi:D-glycero-D-manno-heptose 1,7-bisphosphate phosphatase